MFIYLTLISIWFNVLVSGSNATVPIGGSGIDLVAECEKSGSSCARDDLNIPEDDFLLGDFVRFSKNSITYPRNRVITNNSTDELNELSRSLSEDTKEFFLTHDLEVQLPGVFFRGGILKISPRSLDSNGTTLKVELLPKPLNQSVGEGRIFFNKIGKFISERLVLALLAILLVIKLLAVKFLFILPSMMGVVAAKKLIVKVLLFLFPFLHHLFKLCAYTPYGAKHHIHKHQIAHIHQVAAGHHHHKPYYLDKPPSDSYHFSHKGDPGVIDAHASASEYGNEVHHDPPKDETEDDFWGFSFLNPKTTTKKPFSPLELENMVLKAEKEALIKSRLQKERERIHDENLRLQEQLNNALKVQQKLKHHAIMVNHKRKPGKYRKRNHFSHAPHLTPLLPPPPSPPSKFEEPPKFVGEPPSLGGTLEDVQPHSGPFAEPPANYGESFPKENELLSPNSAPNVVIDPSSPSIEDLPHGVLGGGLPASTVDAVKSYLNQKFSHNPTNFPTYKPNEEELLVSYPTQQANIFVTPPKSDTPQFHAPESGGFNYQVPSPMNVMSNRKSDVTNEEDEFYKAAQITYDAFYSPILQKIDDILNELEFTEEPCKERLICSMYKNPEKFSPHSNLLSAELSRDSKDLQKPTSTNVAVVRFYKYVQAARDGQDQRDCIRLYPACAINTEA
ncbi:unnamed protein product [Phyllotreta striolata]|uniref:Uncharacterized protein n=1 Tax=Phyllotreta striolata TaxID=444603 RepID=A0A9N9TSX1_PHYSR|nr:unnamed protein product [Phyllotreta striolata]